MMCLIRVQGIGRFVIVACRKPFAVYGLILSICLGLVALQAPAAMKEFDEGDVVEEIKIPVEVERVLNAEGFVYGFSSSEGDTRFFVRGDVGKLNRTLDQLGPVEGWQLVIELSTFPPRWEHSLGNRVVEFDWQIFLRTNKYARNEEEKIQEIVVQYYVPSTQVVPELDEINLPLRYEARLVTGLDAFVSEHNAEREMTREAEEE